MIKYYFLFLSFITFSVMASNWMTVSEIQKKGVQGYSLEADCERSGEQCLDVGEEPTIVSAGFVSLEDGWGPEVDPESCEGQEACQSLNETKDCGLLHKFIDANFSRVYCIGIQGKKLQKDLPGLASYKAVLQAKAQTEALIANGKKARETCQRVLDLIGGFNLLPGRTSEQAGQMTASFSEAKQLLQDGRPTAAKTAIQAIPVDGVLVSQAMKDLAIAQLEGY